MRGRDTLSGSLPRRKVCIDLNPSRFRSCRVCKKRWTTGNQLPEPPTPCNQARGCVKDLEETGLCQSGLQYSRAVLHWFEHRRPRGRRNEEQITRLKGAIAQ